MSDMSQFHKISMIKRSHREAPEKLLGFAVQMGQIRHIACQNMPNYIMKYQKFQTGVE